MANKGEADNWPLFVNVTNPEEISVEISGAVSGNAGDAQDADTGAGTDNRDLVGIAIPADGGAVFGGTAATPLQVRNPTLETAVGDVEAALSAGTLLTATETWEALKVGTAPSLDHTFNMEASGVYRYHGFATRGTATSSLTWSIMRIEFTDSNREDAVQFLVNETMAWDDRVAGGTEGWTA